MKTCRHCKINKKIEDFRTVTVRNKKTVLNKCKKCESDYSKKWAKNNPVRFKKNQDKYTNRPEIKKKRREYQKKWWGNLSKEQRLKYRYKITSEKRSVLYRNLRDEYFKKYGFAYTTANTFGLITAKNLYKKFNSACAICSSKKGLCIHHKDGIGYGNCKKLNKPINNLLENLLLVCRGCHMTIHKKGKKFPKKLT